jgi:uncharacterized protein with PIN domain
MARAVFRFYAELNDFLPQEHRAVTFEHEFAAPATVKDRIESLGVPHTEVDLILANGEPVGFDYRVRDGDRISVYPMFEAFDVAATSPLRPKPLREPKFVLDTHLGRLAAYLRMLGFDTFYRSHCDDAELARVSRDEHRILLTRDTGLLKRNAVTHGHFVRETDARKQMVEVVRRFHLERLAAPFTRCLRCNEPLAETSKHQVLADLPPRTAQLHDEFRRCPACSRVYWKGTHYDRMRRLIDSL